MQKPKTFYIRTYGCQMNELDSEIMIGQLEAWGLQRVYLEEEGDVLIFNTCAIRDLSERKVLGKIGQISRLKKREQIIGIAGCMAMTKRESLFQKLPHLDFVIGTNNIHDLTQILQNIIDTKDKQIRTDTQFKEDLDYLLAKRNDPVKAYVSIIRGCNNFCSYCVVPYTRGREVSRSPEDIEQECRILAEKGYKEITLLGQNVNSYGKDQPQWKMHFPDLLSRLDQVQGIERIRFMTSHPKDITKELMKAIRDLPSLCEFVHFPLQSGSNRILKKMNRMYTKEVYFEKVEQLREIVPNIALGTDIIVGFPTETEEDFEETYEFFKKISYSTAFLFIYSPRKEAPAWRWGDGGVSQEIKKERHQKILHLYHQILTEKQSKMIGKKEEILVENSNRQGYLKGRTRSWQKVIFPGKRSLIGTLQMVELHSFCHQTFIGRLIPFTKNNATFRREIFFAEESSEFRSAT